MRRKKLLWIPLAVYSPLHHNKYLHMSYPTLQVKKGGGGGYLELTWPVGADISICWGIEENCATSFLWGCRIMKRSIFKTFWGSNVHWRQRTDRPCEEVEPERIEPKVCCASKSLLMGHGGPLIPVWLFLSLPLAVNTERLVSSGSDFTFRFRNTFLRRSFHRHGIAGGSRLPWR